MKREYLNSLSVLLVMTVYLILLSGCRKDKITDPNIGTLPVVLTTYSSAAAGAILISQGSYQVMDWGVCFSTAPHPVYEYASPSTYRSLGEIKPGDNTVTIYGLMENTTYYLRSYAYYLKTAYGAEVTFKTQKLDTIINFNRNLTYGSLTDIEANTYKTIQIGTQVWMAENLRVTKYRDGSNIKKRSDITDGSDTTGAYCNYGNSMAYVTTFGRLYTYYATVSSHKLCPEGWHIPSDAEWTLLETFLGGPGVSGSSLKESGTSHWSAPNTDATNESGFTALPGGDVFFGNFYDLGNSGLWWFSDECTTRSMNISSSNVSHLSHEYCDRQGDSYSVRCVKDP